MKYKFYGDMKLWISLDQIVVEADSEEEAENKVQIEV